MKKPKISVIVPVYNAEKYLRRCIDSILAQTFRDFELLLIDDGSTDGSGAICDGYASKDSRVRVFHKPNGGVSSARNLGLDNARGEWITFCDSDDWVYPNWIKNYKINKNTEFELISQGCKTDKPIYYYSDKDQLCYGFNFVGTPQSLLLKLYENHIIGYLWIKAFRK